MGKEDKLLNKLGRNHGMKVPEGYFNEFAAKMSQSLPSYPEAPRPLNLTLWQKARPYVYMAAMFAGIWCMMKMFHIASENAMRNNEVVPESVVLAMQDPEAQAYYDYALDNVGFDLELEEELSGQYESIEDFEKDFGYQLSPEYDDMQIS